MATSDEHVAPQGWRTVTPRIVVTDARGFVDFVSYVFGATFVVDATAPTIVQIGDSKLMVSEVGERGRSTAFRYVYVAYAAAAYGRALECGAASLEAPFDTPYGDRRCMVADRWGNTWQIANQSKRDNAA